MVSQTTLFNTKPQTDQLTRTGSTFTRIIHSDTYPFIDSKTQSDHKGRSVFITGGNRGIGKAIAISFAKAGAAFIGMGCPDGFGNVKAEIERAAQSVGRSTPRVCCTQLDVTDSASVREAAAEVKRVWPGLDVLINNAGFMAPALPVVEADENLWWRTFEVNLKGMFHMCKFFTPLLLGTANGLKTMVNINSVAAHNLRPEASAYGTSKWGALKFTEFLLVEQSSQGLLAFSVHPGGIMTQLAEAMPKETHAGMYEHSEAEF
jgi:NAD(P)-dependent dehydrogenase (short-subunit alcohol dehydrogenase family)